MKYCVSAFEKSNFLGAAPPPNPCYKGKNRPAGRFFGACGALYHPTEVTRGAGEPNRGDSKGTKTHREIGTKTQREESEGRREDRKGEETKRQRDR